MVLQSIEGLAPLSADPLMALQGHLGLLYMELWQHCSWSEAWDASFNLGRERSQHFHRQISVKERLNTKYRTAGESDDRGKILPLQSQWSLEADFWARKWKDIEIGGFVGNGQGKSVPLLSSSHSEEGRSHPCNWYTSCVTQHTKEGFWKEQGRSVSALSCIPLLREGGWSLRKSNVAKSNVANAHLYQSRPANSSWICSNISVQVWQKNTSQESNIFQEFGELERNGGEQGDRFPFCHCCIPPWKGDGEGKPSPHVIGRSSKHSFSARIVSIATLSHTQRFLFVEF